MARPSPTFDERVLLLVPSTRDAVATRGILSDYGVETFICETIEQVSCEAARGAGAALLAEEHLLADASGSLAGFLRNQPPWSDFPLIVLLRAGIQSPHSLEALKEIGNMTLTGRPVPIAGLVSTIQAALRDRRRQYAVRDLLFEREQVTAELARDVMRRKEAEQKLRQVAANLSDADRRKDEFLAMLAHELRNPLAAISSALHLLDLPSATVDQTKAARQIAQRQVAQLERLIDDLLDISRITRGKVQLRKSVFGLARVIEQAVETVRPLVNQRKHTLTVEHGSEQEMYVRGDPARIEQIVVNLLTNAAKYTPDGGRIRLSTRSEGDWHLISVVDTGEGIPPDILPTVFELFTQAPRSLARSEGGLGIGLTLVKALVEMHGGTVSATSTQGKGSEFLVRVPAAQPPARLAAALAGPPEGAAKPQRILVVDDNRDSARMMGLLLELSGHHVDFAYDGPEAIQTIRSMVPDVVLLDIGLPGANGYEVAECIRRDRSMRQPIIIAVSGYGQAQDRRRSQEAGFNAHLVKPIDQTRLLALLAGGVVAD